MKNLREADLKDKKVLLRADFDIPVSDSGQVEESFRIKRQKETLDYLVDHGAKVIMAAHISDPSTSSGQAKPSFASLMPQLHMFLGYEINFLKTVPEIDTYLENYAGPALLDNIRQNDGEKENDPEFARQLAAGFDVYINNDFAVCHRDHASVSAVAKLLPSYAGFVIEEEVARLSEVISSPKEGKVVIIGGAKAESKVPVIKNFIDKADKILIGGVVANDVLKEKGQDIGASIADENSKELLSGLDINSSVLALPKDFVISENKFLDIGQETMKEYSKMIGDASMVIWNGPMGLFEKPEFSYGTKAVAESMVSSKAKKIIGGGDTIKAVDGLGLLGKFDFVSTGGGAMLAFLAGQKLPGLEALGYYN